MRIKTPIPGSLLRLSENQSGVMSRSQVLAHGLGRHAIARLLRDQQWHAVTDSIYSRSPSPSWNALAWSGVLIAGDAGVLGAQAALHLHGVGDPPGIITVWSGQRRLQDRKPWQFRQGRRSARGSPPRVSLEDATLETCAMASLDGLVATLAVAVTSRRTTIRRLRQRAEELPNLRNRSLVLEMLTEVTGGIESPLELRYARDVELAHALPHGIRQATVSEGTRSDATYSEFGVLVELDGRLGHSGDGAFRDAGRDNLHTVAGFVTLRFGWNDVVNNPCAVADQVATVLTNRGWPGQVRRCRRCRLPIQATAT